MNTLIVSIIAVLLQAGHGSLTVTRLSADETTIQIGRKAFVCVYNTDDGPAFDVGADDECNTVNRRLHQLFPCDPWGDMYSGCFGE